MANYNRYGNSSTRRKTVRNRLNRNKLNQPPFNRDDFNRGICPNGRPIKNKGWQAVLQAQNLFSAGEGGGQSLYYDYNGDGKIDVADIYYFLN